MGRYLKENKLILFLTVLFGVAAAAASAFISVVLQQIIDVAVGGELSSFLKLLIFTAIYMVVLCLVSYLSSLCGKYLVCNLSKQLRKNVFEGIMGKTPKDFYEVNTADYISAISNDVKMVEENYILPILSTIELTVMFFVTLFILLILSPVVTASLIICMLLMFTVPALLGKILEKRQERVSQQLSIFTGKLKDIFSGYEIIRSFRVLPHTKTQFEKENTAVANVKFSADKMFALNEGLSDTLSTLGVVAVIFVSAYLVLTKNITIGTLLALTQLSGTFMTPVVMIMQNIPKIKGMKPVIERLNVFSDYRDTEFSGQQPFEYTDGIQLQNVSFSYNEKSNALSNVNYKFKKGKKYAIVGRSGCGKSTLIKLLTGYTTRFSGNILFDNIDIRQLNIEELYNYISVIHQNIYMFDTTIGENISMFYNFSQEEWNTALSISGVSLFLKQMENGLDSPVGENGANLSGGQRQRIAVARALIRKTPIMILDEGTSAIDMQTACEIESKLLTQEGLTLITITHSMNSEMLQRYDEVIYMENGMISGAGNLNELLILNDSFREFQQVQS